MTEPFDPYHIWLGIPPADQPPHAYRLLGLEAFESNLVVIENAADRQMAHVRVHQSGRHAEHSQALLNEISAARVCLLDTSKKAEYDEQLRASLNPPSVERMVAPPPPPTLPVDPVTAPGVVELVAAPPVNLPTQSTGSGVVPPVLPSAPRPHSSIYEPGQIVAPYEAVAPTADLHAEPNAGKPIPRRANNGNMVWVAALIASMAFAMGIVLFLGLSWRGSSLQAARQERERAMRRAIEYKRDSLPDPRFRVPQDPVPQAEDAAGTNDQEPGETSPAAQPSVDPAIPPSSNEIPGTTDPAVSGRGADSVADNGQTASATKSNAETRGSSTIVGTGSSAEKPNGRGSPAGSVAPGGSDPPEGSSSTRPESAPKPKPEDTAKPPAAPPRRNRNNRAHITDTRISVSGFDKDLDIDCDDHEVTVSGFNHRLRITGPCKALRISGNGHIITVDQVGEISVGGSNNLIEYRRGIRGRPNIRATSGSRVVRLRRNQEGAAYKAGSSTDM